MVWSTEEKVRMFDEISERFYHQNFGSLSKADMELLMFRFYLEKEFESARSKDGMIDYNKCSDYSIGKKLGITQQKVKSLKIKKQLIYPRALDWQKDFAALIKNARYEKESNKITLSIPDPNLLLEIQNYVEEKGGYISIQLNRKLLQLRVEYFFEIAFLDEDEAKKAQIIKELKKELKKHNKEEQTLDEKNIGQSLETIGNVTSILADVLTICMPGNLFASALRGLLIK